jgi:hydrogenase maturation protease
MRKSVLVLGVGNVLLSDEGIGVHVVRRLQSLPVPDSVEVIDGGTCGYELIAFFSGRTKVIIVDCLKAAKPPGSVICATPDELDMRAEVPVSAHEGGLSELLHHARLLPCTPEILIVGIVPGHIGPGCTLSEKLQDMVDVFASKVLQIAA